MQEFKEFKAFKRIANQYEGKIQELKDSVSITAVVPIAGYVSEVETEYTLECRTYVDKGEHKFFLSGHEKGHWSGFTESYSVENIEKLFKKYKFKPKAQISLFDFL